MVYKKSQEMTEGKMAKVKIDKIKIPERMSNEEKIKLLEKHILSLENNLEYILTHISQDNFA